MKTVQGDLIAMAENGDFDIIVHGANCHNTMGSGIAGQLVRKFPQVRAADLQTVEGSMEKLGTISTAPVFSDDYMTNFIVVNAYTQYNYGHNGGRFCSYDAIAEAFENIDKAFPEEYVRFGIPLIGAGLAGGNWTAISAIIEDAIGHRDITVVEYQP